MEALLSDPNREIICDTLLKSNAKANVAVRGNFPAARDFAEPDTYTTTCRRAVGNRSSSEVSSESSPRHRVNDHPPTSDPSSKLSPRSRKRSNKQAIRKPPRYEQAAGRPPGLRRTDRRDTRNPPAAAGPAPPNLQYASETTVDREGDGRIRKGLESLGGR